MPKSELIEVVPCDIEELDSFPQVEEKYDVIRRKRFDVEPMTVEEAILQMNLLGHQFFFFKNAEEDDVPAVIYKRAAGGYGLIESN